MFCIQKWSARKFANLRHTWKKWQAGTMSRAMLTLLYDGVAKSLNTTSELQSPFPGTRSHRFSSQFLRPQITGVTTDPDQPPPPFPGPPYGLQPFPLGRGSVRPWSCRNYICCSYRTADMVSVAKRLPTTARDAQIPCLVTILSRILCSRCQERRDLVQDSEPVFSIPRTHVLVHVTHSVIPHFTSGKHASNFSTFR